MNLACSTFPVSETAACAVLTPEERNAMATAGRTRLLKRGEMLFAALLHDFAAAASDGSCHLAPHFELPLTRGEIGNMLGLTIETVSRKLGELEEMGAIRREGIRGIALCNPELLHKISGR